MNFLVKFLYLSNSKQLLMTFLRQRYKFRTMKKLLLLFAVTFIATASFAQRAVQLTSENLAKAKTSGVYVIATSDDLTATEVEGVKGYYKDYFTVAMNDAKHEMTVTLIKKEEMNIRVMNRLMVALDVEKFVVDGQGYTFDELYNKFMK